MSKLSLLALGWGAAAGILLGIGCGKSMRDDEVGAARGGGGPEFSARTLDARIAVPAAGDPGKPGDPDSDGPVNADRTFSPEEIVFNREVPLVGTPVYLAWRKDALPSPIVLAYYFCDRQLPGTRACDRKPAQTDSGAYWFIPLLDLLDGRADHGDPAVMHRLTLELHLADGSIREYHVRFRLAGPLPPLERKHRLLAATGVLADWSANVTGAGLPIMREELINRSNRDLRAWFKADPRIELVTRLAITRHAREAVANQVSTRVERHFSSVPLKLTEARTELHPIDHRVEKPETTVVPVREDDWAWFAVPAGRRLLVSWVVAAPAAVRCPLPGESEQVFRWEWVEERCTASRGGNCSYDTRRSEQRRTDSWAISGGTIRGTWWPEIRVSDLYLSDPERVDGKHQVSGLQGAPPASGLLFKAQAEFLMQAGESTPWGTELSSCSGLFL